MRKSAYVFAAIVVCWAGPAAAQEQSFANLFVGGGYLLADADVAAANAIGVGAAVDFNVTENVSVFLDWGYQTFIGGGDSVAYATLGGVSFSINSPGGGKRLFYRVFAGGVELDASSTDSAWSLGAGLGLDVDVTDRLAVRAFQLDHITSFFGGAHQSNFRVSSGLVFKLGRR